MNHQFNQISPSQLFNESLKGNFQLQNGNSPFTFQSKWINQTLQQFKLMSDQDKRQQRALIPQNVYMADWVWPDGILPYMIHQSFTYEMRELLKKAIQEFEKRTSIRFKYITDTSTYKQYLLYLKSEEKQYSYTEGCGRILGKTVHHVYILPEEPMGTYLHETMHILGFKHTQCREDRDIYVILEEEIKNDPQYQKQPQYYMIGTYDPESIMHYSLDNNMKAQKEFEKCGFGQNEKLSDKDIKGIELIYGNKKCTFDVFNEEQIPQMYIQCYTCSGSYVCIPCGQTCHKNHKVKIFKQFRIFCCICGQDGHKCNNINGIKSQFLK